MAKFCVRCGDPLGTRDLLHESAHCEPCQDRIKHDHPSEAQAGTGGLLEFFSEVEKRSPLTGRLNLP